MLSVPKFFGKLPPKAILDFIFYRRFSTSRGSYKRNIFLIAFPRACLLIANSDALFLIKKIFFEL